MEETATNLQPPRFEERKSFCIAGLSERYNNRKIEGIPAQWQRFAPQIGKIPGDAGRTTYGVCCNFDDTGNMDYICAVEVSDGAAIPPGLITFGLITLHIPEQKYAVFVHRDHISKIGQTWDAIFTKGLPAAGLKCAKAPQFEAYRTDFNPQTGMGAVEIWIPIERVVG